MFRFFFYCFAAAFTTVLCATASAAGEIGIIPQDALVQIGRSANLCAITFDDGPGQYTPKLLRILKKHNVKATFFLLGDRIRAYPRTVRRIAEAGHEIGNHSLGHKRLRKLSIDDQYKQIAEVQNLLRDLGIECRLLRPPYGEFGHDTIAEAKKQGLDIILWTVDSEDWVQKPSVDTFMSPTGRDHPSTGIFLFHDIHAHTVDFIPELITCLKNSGCTFVTVSEYLGNTTPPIRPLPARKKIPQRYQQQGR